MTQKHLGAIARKLLARMPRFARIDLVDANGHPTGQVGDIIEEGTLSSSERALLGVVLMILDYGWSGDDRPPISLLSSLDAGNLRAVGKALIELAEGWEHR